MKPPTVVYVSGVIDVNYVADELSDRLNGY